MLSTTTTNHRHLLCLFPSHSVSQLGLSPRLFVDSRNHLASLSTWALASSPPAYIFSPLETRIRETQPLHLALHHAIPMSMYAWPADSSPRQSGIPLRLPSPSPYRSPVPQHLPDAANRQRRLSAPCSTTENISPPELVRSDSQQEKQYPPAPVASLTITSDPFTSPNGATVPPPVDRIPLWALAPGVGVLHGSTSASVGVRLGDFSALNLEDEQTDLNGTTNASTNPSLRSSIGIPMTRNNAPTGLPNQPKLARTISTSLDPQRLRPRVSLIAPAVPAVETPSRPITPSRALLQQTNTIKMGSSMTMKMQRHTAPHLSRPDKSGIAPASQNNSSWPSPLSKVSGWRKGRKEQMEDVIEQLGWGSEMIRLSEELEGLSIPEERVEDRSPVDGKGSKGVHAGNKDSVVRLL